MLATPKFVPKNSQIITGHKMIGRISNKYMGSRLHSCVPQIKTGHGLCAFEKIFGRLFGVCSITVMSFPFFLLFKRVRFIIVATCYVNLVSFFFVFCGFRVWIK